MVGLDIDRPARAPLIHRVDKANYTARGGAARMFASSASELLYEGPANCGKTMAVTEKCHLLAETFPDLRILWVRKTRKSLSQSVLTTFEERVLPKGHPCIHGTASKEHRESYKYPNGTVIVLGGMDNPDKVMSTEYDIIVFFEATEGTLGDWLRLVTRVRNKRILLGVERVTQEPIFFHQMIADCNPGSQFHWLNRRAEEGNMHRIRARHTDNPRFGREDQARLDSLTGTARKRLRDGIWCAESGQVFKSWDPETMTCNRQDLLIHSDRPHGGYRFDWLYGAIDFGMRHATCFQVWGVIGDKIYRVVEIYKREKSQSWWAEKIAVQMQRWNLEAIVADGGGLGISMIDYLNDQLGTRGGRDQRPIVRPARKGPGSRLLGFKMVQDLMEAGKIILCNDAQEEGACQVSLDLYSPTCLEQELPAFVWQKNPDGSPLKDDSDRGCVDDAIFTMIYAVDWKFGRDLTPAKKNTYDPGTIGDTVGHAEWLESLDRETQNTYDDGELLG